MYRCRSYLSRSVVLNFSSNVDLVLGAVTPVYLGRHFVCIVHRILNDIRVLDEAQETTVIERSCMDRSRASLHSSTVQSRSQQRLTTGAIVAVATQKINGVRVKMLDCES
jgi:hypothetical protein